LVHIVTFLYYTLLLAKKTCSHVYIRVQSQLLTLSQPLNAGEPLSLGEAGSKSKVLGIATNPRE